MSEINEELFEEPYEKDRSRGDRRKKDFRVAAKKRKKAQDAYGCDRYPQLHRYSKGKIHCSCPLCRMKSDLKKCGIRASDIDGRCEFPYWAERFSTKLKRFRSETVLEKYPADPKAYGAGFTKKSAMSHKDYKKVELMNKEKEEYLLEEVK